MFYRLTLHRKIFADNQSSVQSVLLLRPDNLGDLVLFSGVLRHIRAFYPQAEITLCVKRYVCNLLEQCPYIDQLLCWEEVTYNLSARPTLAWLPEVRGRWRLQQSLRSFTRQLMRLRYRTDVLLLPVRSPTPLIHSVAGSIPARARFGIAGDLCNQSAQDDQAAGGLYTGRLQLSSERSRDHEVAVTRDFLRFLGIQVAVDDLWPEFWTDNADQRWAEETIPRKEGSVTLAICPGVTSLPGKFYSGENYAHTLAALGNIRFAVVLFGGASEQTQCAEVAQALGNCENVVSLVNLAGRSTIRQLIEGLRRCDAVLAQETAALHMAVALGRPTVGIVGGGHFGRFYPWGDPQINRTAQQSMECYWCNWRCPYPSIRCIQEILPFTVVRELRTALQMDVTQEWTKAELG